MTICKPTDLLGSLAPGMRVLGLDLGTRNIGLALSDVGRQIATPYETIRRTKLKMDIERIRATVAKEGVGGLVIGLPLNMDGSEGPRCQATRQFAADLGKAIGLPLCFWDERLSTLAAENLLIEGGMSRRKRGQVIDKVAAAVILQGCLDHVASRPPAAGG